MRLERRREETKESPKSLDPPSGTVSKLDDQGPSPPHPPDAGSEAKSCARLAPFSEFGFAPVS